MIKEFVARYEEKKQELREIFEKEHPDCYMDIIKAVVGILNDGYDTPNTKFIHEIDDGDYQGTLIYVIGAEGYQPDDYWYVKVGYGSCSGCDTLCDIRDYDDGKPSESQVKDYMTLALHVVQGLKKMGDDVV